MAVVKRRAPSSTTSSSTPVAARKPGRNNRGGGPSHHNRNRKNRGGGGGNRNRNRNRNPGAATDGYQDQLGESDPVGAWNAYWGAQGFGRDNPLYGNSAFRSWFENDFYKQQYGNWQTSQHGSVAPKDRVFWKDWMGANLNPGLLQSQWRSQSNATRGLMGRSPTRWTAF